MKAFEFGRAASTGLTVGLSETLWDALGWMIRASAAVLAATFKALAR